MTNELPAPDAPAETPQPDATVETQAADAPAVTQQPDAAPVEAAPAFAPQMAAPVPTPRPKRRDRVLGTVGQVVGVIGIVVCLLLVAGVVAGRGWVVGTVDDVTASVDAQIAKADPLLTQASARVGEISGRVSTIADVASGIANNPSPGGALADTLRTGLTNVSDRYQALRSAYSDVRESAASVISKLQTLDRIVPGFSIPQGPVDALAALDARLQEFDAAVTDLTTIDPGQGPINQAAAAVAQKANDVNAKLTTVQSGIADVQSRVTALQAKLADTAASVKLAITLGAGGAIVLLLYVAFLHWILFRYAREVRARAITA